jgi:hypothetical protein
MLLGYGEDREFTQIHFVRKHLIKMDLREIGCGEWRWMRIMTTGGIWYQWF